MVDVHHLTDKVEENDGNSREKLLGWDWLTPLPTKGRA